MAARREQRGYSLGICAFFLLLLHAHRSREFPDALPRCFPAVLNRISPCEFEYVSVFKRITGFDQYLPQKASVTALGQKFVVSCAFYVGCRLYELEEKVWDCLFDPSIWKRSTPTYFRIVRMASSGSPINDPTTFSPEPSAAADKSRDS